jgi:hypothetical protein
MHNYPINQSDFKEIIKGGYLYVDKTKLIHTLIESGEYYFLGRPRHFGKSLLLSTIRELFNGNRQLFKGLWIEDQWDWKQKHPVIYLYFDRMDYRKLSLEEAISRELDAIAFRLGIILEEKFISQKFRELIYKASVNGEVVILIDGDDQPVKDCLHDLSKVKECLSVFGSFYSVIKDSGKYIRFLLIAAEFRISRPGIFSGFNNLEEITFRSQYATLTGITQEELESNFGEEISELQKANPDILQDLKAWYNGYSWNEGINTVYTPSSLFHFMATRELKNYWVQTGLFTFLAKEIQASSEISSDQKEFRVGEEGLYEIYDSGYLYLAQHFIHFLKFFGQG